MTYAFTHMNLGLEARIWASRLGLRSRDWDLGFKTGIWVARLGLEGRPEGGAKEKEKDEEKIPHMFESIGHRPLRSCCPKGQLTHPSESLLQNKPEKLLGKFKSGGFIF